MAPLILSKNGVSSCKEGSRRVRTLVVPLVHLNTSVFTAGHTQKRVHRFMSAHRFTLKTNVGHPNGFIIVFLFVLKHFHAYK